MVLALISPDIIGLIAGFFTAAAMLPQLIKIIKEKKAEDISVPMLMILITGLGLWIYYGTTKEDWPIIITNAISLIFNLAIIVFKFKYKQSPSPQN